MWTTASPRCRAARRSGESFPSSSLASRAPHRPDDQVRRLGGRAPARRLVRGRVGRRVRVRRARRGRARPARARRARRDRRSRRRRSRRRPRRARRGAGGRGRARGAKRARTRRERRHGFRDGVFPHPLVARGSGARGVDGARRVLRRLCERCARPSFLARAFAGPESARFSHLPPPARVAPVLCVPRAGCGGWRHVLRHDLGAGDGWPYDQPHAARVVARRLAREALASEADLMPARSDASPPAAPESDTPDEAAAS